jgi:hypothetical protein
MDGTTVLEAHACADPLYHAPVAGPLNFEVCRSAKFAEFKEVSTHRISRYFKAKISAFSR